MPLKENINPLEGSKIQWSRIALYFIGVIFVLLASVAVGTVLYLNTFADKVYPGVSIGSQYMGGKNHSEIKNILENFNDKIFKDGLVVILPASHREVVLDLNTDGSPDNAIELIKINSEETAQQALSIGRHGSWWQRAFWPLYYRWFGYRLPAVIQTDRGQLLQIGRAHV